MLSKDFFYSSGGLSLNNLSNSSILVGAFGMCRWLRIVLNLFLLIALKKLGVQV